MSSSSAMAFSTLTLFSTLSFTLASPLASTYYTISAGEASPLSSTADSTAEWRVSAHRQVGCPYQSPATAGVGSSPCLPLIIGTIFPGESSLEVNPANCMIKFWGSSDCTLGEGEHYYAIGGGDSLGCSNLPAALTSFRVEC